jgi:hypothetical protein
MVEIVRSGGYRLVNCLFIGLGPSNTTSPKVMLKVALTDTTSNLFVSNCEFENYSDRAVDIDSSVVLNNIIISGCEFVDGRNTAKQAIYVNHGYRVNIANNLFLGSGQAYAAVRLDNTTHGVLIGNYWEGYNAFLDGSGQSDINTTDNYT